MHRQCVLVPNTNGMIYPLPVSVQLKWSLCHWWSSLSNICWVKSLPHVRTAYVIWGGAMKDAGGASSLSFQEPGFPALITTVCLPFRGASWSAKTDIYLLAGTVELGQSVCDCVGSLLLPRDRRSTASLCVSENDWKFTLGNRVLSPSFWLLSPRAYLSRGHRGEYLPWLRTSW